MTSNEDNTQDFYKVIPDQQASEDESEEPRVVLDPDFFGDFLNWGYWTVETETQIQACENLANLVMDSIPKLEGKNLEVGCGHGGVTQMIAQRIDQELITAINIVEHQLEICREKLPRASFVNMDASAMSFPDASFRNVVSVEAAHHFSSREDFFRGVFRVLEPGGYLTLCDIIAHPLHGRRSHVADPRAYQELLMELGFCEVRVTDITADSTHAHADFVTGWLAQRRQQGQLSKADRELGELGSIVRLALSPFYVVARARKPIEGRPSWRTRPNEHLDACLLRTAKMAREA